MDKWPGKESFDSVNYYNGLKFVREFTDWIDGVGYELIIGETDGKKSKVIWRIDKIDDVSSYLNITIYPHDINKYPLFIRPIVYNLFVKPSLHNYLSSVLKGFQWHVTTNERVKKNQFGSHKWFSD